MNHSSQKSQFIVRQEIDPSLVGVSPSGETFQTHRNKHTNKGVSMVSGARAFNMYSSSRTRGWETSVSRFHRRTESAELKKRKVT